MMKQGSVSSLQCYSSITYRDTENKNSCSFGAGIKNLISWLLRSVALAWRTSYKGGTSNKGGYLIREAFSGRRWRHVANRCVCTGMCAACFHGEHLPSDTTYIACFQNRRDKRTLGIRELTNFQVPLDLLSTNTKSGYFVRSPNRQPRK